MFFRGGNKYYYLSFLFDLLCCVSIATKAFMVFSHIIFFCNLVFSWGKCILLILLKANSKYFLCPYKTNIAILWSFGVAWLKKMRNQVGYCFKRSFIAEIYQCKWKDAVVCVSVCVRNGRWYSKPFPLLFRDQNLSFLNSSISRWLLNTFLDLSTTTEEVKKNEIVFSLP